MNRPLFIIRFVLLLCGFMVFQEGKGYHVFEKDCMGAKFVVLIDEDDRSKARKGATAAFEEGERLNSVLSDYESSSELTRFSESSRTGEKFMLSQDLFEVLSHSQGLAKDTEGCFDVTIGPLSRLWRIARFRTKKTARRQIGRRLAKSRLSKSEPFGRGSLGTLRTPGMVLDLGGIAKGFAADKMLETLKRKGLGRCLINAGGDLVLGDPPRGTPGWRVEIGGLQHQDLPVLHLSNLAVATSGDIEQFVVVDGKRYSHLIDPGTGLGLTTQCQVTVLASTGIQADSLASAFPVMGLNKAQEYLDKKAGITVYYLQKERFRNHQHAFGAKRQTMIFSCHPHPNPAFCFFTLNLPCLEFAPSSQEKGPESAVVSYTRVSVKKPAALACNSSKSTREGSSPTCNGFESSCRVVKSRGCGLLPRYQSRQSRKRLALVLLLFAVGAFDVVRGE